MVTKSPRPKSPDQRGSIAEALNFSEHLERQQEIKETSESFEGLLDDSGLTPLRGLEK